MDTMDTVDIMDTVNTVNAGSDVAVLSKFHLYFWKKDILSLFLLDGTIYGDRNEDPTFTAFTGNTYCAREREMYFL